jgi:hypothetical protein
MKHLGKYLLENGILTTEQLEDALQSQVAFGGRLGTNLVELGYLSLDDLGRHLSEHTGIPAPSRECLETPDVAALQAVPVELVQRHRVLPLKLDGRTLHLAMMDPWDARKVDEIAFATGLRVKPYVLPEITAFHWLDYHYDIPREIRHVDLDAQRRVDAEREAWERQRRGPGVVQVAPEARALGIAPLDVDEELVGERTFSELQSRLFAAQEDASRRPASGGQADRGASGAPTGPPPAPPAREHAPAGPARIAELDVKLGVASTREAIAAVALELAAQVSRVAALFLVRDKTISGMQAIGDDVPERIESVLLGSDLDSSFAAAAASGEPLRTPPQQFETDRRVLTALGRAEVREIAIFPVEIRGRTVNLLYVDNGPDPIGNTAFAALRAVCEGMAAAYERLILERKRRLT